MNYNNIEKIFTVGLKPDSLSTNIWYQPNFMSLKVEMFEMEKPERE